MRKLRLVAVIVFGAYGGAALYKYLSEDGRVFVSREKLPESETVTNVPQPVEVVEEKSSMDEYVETHKDDVTEILSKTLTKGPDSMEEYFESHKNDVAEKVKEKIKEKVEEVKAPEIEIKAEEVKLDQAPIEKVQIYKKESSKNGCCKHYKAKYCVKIDHSKDRETPNEIIMRHFQ